MTQAAKTCGGRPQGVPMRRRYPVTGRRKRLLQRGITLDAAAFFVWQHTERKRQFTISRLVFYLFGIGEQLQRFLHLHCDKLSALRIEVYIVGQII